MPRSMPNYRADGTAMLRIRARAGTRLDASSIPDLTSTCDHDQINARLRELRPMARLSVRPLTTRMRHFATSPVALAVSTILAILVTATVAFLSAGSGAVDPSVQQGLIGSFSSALS